MTKTREEVVELMCRAMYKASVSYKPYHSDEFLLIYRKDACVAYDALIAAGVIPSTRRAENDSGAQNNTVLATGLNLVDDVNNPAKAKQ